HHLEAGSLEVHGRVEQERAVRAVLQQDAVRPLGERHVVRTHVRRVAVLPTTTAELGTTALSSLRCVTVAPFIGTERLNEIALGPAFAITQSTLRSGTACQPLSLLLFHFPAPGKEGEPTAETIWGMPAGPWGPVGPTRPWGPVTPATPCGPVGPGAPTAPSAPAGPCGPVAPATPCGPCAPVAPCAPFAPAGPWGPVAPCGPAAPTAPVEP